MRRRPPDLEILLLTRHSDPGTGESTYSVSNITRGESAAGLFDVPADDTIKESSYMRGLPLSSRGLKTPRYLLKPPRYLPALRWIARQRSQNPEHPRTADPRTSGPADSNSVVH